VIFSHTAVILILLKVAWKFPVWHYSQGIKALPGFKENFFPGGLPGLFWREFFKNPEGRINFPRKTGSRGSIFLAGGKPSGGGKGILGLSRLFSFWIRVSY